MFFVNTTTFLDQDDPNITVFADGRFAITWTDEKSSPDDPSLTAVRGQIFDPRIGAGSPSGPQGTPGDDSIAAPSGSSQINGGAGIDTITFDFKLTDVSVSYVGNQVIIDGPSSHTVLTGFEKYRVRRRHRRQQRPRSAGRRPVLLLAQPRRVERACRRRCALPHVRLARVPRSERVLRHRSISRLNRGRAGGRASIR